jgi:hypothetical protein
MVTNEVSWSNMSEWAVFQTKSCWWQLSPLQTLVSHCDTSRPDSDQCSPLATWFHNWPSNPTCQSQTGCHFSLPLEKSLLAYGRTSGTKFFRPSIKNICCLLLSLCWPLLLTAPDIPLDYLSHSQPEALVVFTLSSPSLTLVPGVGLE